MLEEDTLRLILLVLLTLLCISVVRIIRKRFFLGAPAKQKFKGQWVRNKHIRSVDEAEYYMREALEGLMPSLNLKAPKEN